jgi:hypothetical protein
MSTKDDLKIDPDVPPSEGDDVRIYFRPPQSEHIRAVDGMIVMDEEGAGEFWGLYFSGGGEDE